MKNKFDILVIGAGHAGIEASLSAARMGMKVGLITMRLDNMGMPSCNPSIGGSAKGHLVKEIDALGGEMGFLADKAGISFKMLNISIIIEVQFEPKCKGVVMMANHRIYSMSFASVYPHYIKKAEKKGTFKRGSR